MNLAQSFTVCARFQYGVLTVCEWRFTVQSYVAHFSS